MGHQRDPRSPEQLREAGHAAVDWLADLLGRIDELPITAHVEPGAVRAALPDHPPEQPESFAQVLEDLDGIIVPGLTHWQHPGWFAFFPGNSSPPSVLGELLSAGLGVQGMSWATSPAATELESLVLDWLVELLGLPRTWRVDTGPGGGVILGTASEATHTSLVVAREQARARDAPTDDLVVYASVEAHSSVQKGARVAGFHHVRLLATTPDGGLDPAALAAAIAVDRAQGLVPTALVSCVGTTGRGALDPLDQLVPIARSEGLWHHVDAAWAGTMWICPELRHHTEVLGSVDSWVTNPHKYLFTNVDCTAFWVADRRPLLDAMSITPSYLRNETTDRDDVIDYRDWHVGLGRRFRSLKLWLVLRMFGAEQMRTILREHVRLARDLADRIEQHAGLELMGPSHWPLVCFRAVAGDDRTRAIAAAVNASESLAVTVAEDVDGHPYVRVSIGQANTGQADVDRLWAAITAA
ncbi:MAG TPA: pyridoxal-dependent decarboxylase [Nitriliruptorales bacterium]